MHRYSGVFTSVLATLGVCCTVLPSVAQMHYSVTDLGVFGGTSSQGVGINNLGQVTGEYRVQDRSTGAFQFRAFRWTPGKGVLDLGTLGGAQIAGMAINNHGEVTGWGLNERAMERGFFWDSRHGMQDIGSLSDSTAYAFDLNDHGQVVGYSYAGFGNGEPAILWDHGHGMRSLGTLGGSFSYGAGINNAGQVVGWSYLPDPNGVVHAFLWEQGAMRDLGTLPGGKLSWAVGINERGQIVGNAFTSQQRMDLVLWDPHTGIQDLGNQKDYPISSGIAINNRGEILASGSTGGFGGTAKSRPFLWSQGKWIDITTLIPASSGITLTDVYGLNDLGQIVGSALPRNGILGLPHAVVLTPSVPEPSVFASGMVCVLTGGTFFWFRGVRSRGAVSKRSE